MKPDTVSNPSVMNRIGYLYDEGLGVAKDHLEALKWYRKAAEAGLSVAQFNLGLTYEQGQGGSKKHKDSGTMVFKSC